MGRPKKYFNEEERNNANRTIEKHCLTVYLFIMSKATENDSSAKTGMFCLLAFFVSKSFHSLYALSYNASRESRAHRVLPS